MSRARDNFYSLRYIIISPDVQGLLTFFSKLCVIFILQWIAFIFGRNEEEDQ